VSATTDMDTAVYDCWNAEFHCRASVIQLFAIPCRRPPLEAIHYPTYLV